MDDPRYLSGELTQATKGTIVVKDSEGNRFSVAMDDPRYLSGELIPQMKGTKRNWSDERKAEIYNDDRRAKNSASNQKNRLIELTCPHCGKVGKFQGMKSHHFDNCRKKTIE